MVARIKTRKLKPDQDGYYYNSAKLENSIFSLGRPIIYYRYKPTIARGGADFKKLKDIIILKTDQFDQPIEKDNPATFGIYNTKNALIQRESSKDRGLIEFKKLAPGNYTLKEIEAPNGFELSKTIYQLILKEDGTYTINGKDYSNENPFHVVNHKKLSIHIKKIDKESKTSLAGAVFKLESVDKKYNVTIGGNDNVNQFNFEGLEPGNYVLTETKAPKGHLKIAPIEFNLKSLNGSTEINFTKNSQTAKVVGNRINLTIPNERINVKLKKQDTEGHALPGVIFQLRKYVKDKKLYEEVVENQIVSNSNGEIVLNYLEPGEQYQLWELKPLDGYEMPKEEVSRFKIDEKGQVNFENGFNEEITNKSIGVEITLIKKDETTRKLLDHAFFEIEKEDKSGDKKSWTFENGKEKISKWETKNGYFKTYFKEDGVYHIKEVQAPAGYRLPSNPYVARIEVKGGKIISNGKQFIKNDIIVTNRRGEFPKTGSAGEFYYLLSGVILLIMCGYLYKYTNREVI
ncbi:SpaA isopeptide-forming pilin-related protein [Atopobacter phocae]|uniref:SpaA isopeptide-forming pilin-related protein n=1 Tax=Atopobacter phocae TaxID=136492 RepID=UPI000471C07C|nr:SpaA isopeptide-forming pilin-related protein [Atopobacter phocae]